MADNPSTQAQHLTDLTVGIQGILDNLQKVREETDTTAEYLRSTMKGSLTGITADLTGALSTDNNGASEQKKAVDATVNSIRKLLEQYSNLKKRMDDLATSTTGLSTDYSDYRNRIDGVINDLSKMIEGQTDANKKIKDSGEYVKEAREALQEYRTEISLINSSLEEGGKSQQQYVDSLKDLQSKLLGQATGAEKSGFSETAESFRALAEEAKRLRENIGIGGITEEQQVAFRNLKTEVKDLTISYRELQDEATKLKSQPKPEPAIDVSKTLTEINKFTNEYASFQNTLSRSKLDDAIGTPLANIKNRAASARQELEQISTTIRNSGTVTKEQAQRIQELGSTLDNLKRELKDADTQARETGTGFKQIGEGAKAAGGFVADFVSKLSDKVKWLAAFQLITLVQNSFREVASTIKDTEDSVIELQRVLNDDRLANSTISDKLYDIAYRYGQTFENVQETAVLFAQTGKSWNEVLQATEATMLGLNTAELDVTTATQGLIAVMSQFKIPASELESVIDRINITADNFPVTSEKIVEALQRAGSAAYNYGLSLNETIGIITALSEATGRAGANLGTAINSLINFTMKASSLETFSEYLGGLDLSGLNVLEVWTLLGEKIQGTGDELAEMMASSEDFAGLFSEEMAEAVGALDEYTAAVGNAEGVYQTAGTYRKNYFIALLNNIDTAINAIQNMSDAEGYSISENEKYMNTLTAQLNQLKDAASELAVQFGDVGFLDFAKFVVQASTGVLKLTKDVGGLQTVLIGLLTILFQIKKVAIMERLNAWAGGIKSAWGQLQALGYTLTHLQEVTATYNMYMMAGATSTEAFTIATNGLKLSLGSIAAVFMLVYSAVNLVTNKYKEWKEETIASNNEAIQSAKELYNEYKEVLALYNAQDGSEGKQNELLKALGFSKEEIQTLKDEYEDLGEYIDDLIEKKKELVKADLEEAITRANKNFSTMDTGKIEDRFGNIYNILKDIEGIDVSLVYDQFSGLTNLRFPAIEDLAEDVDDAKAKISQIDSAIYALQKKMAENPSNKDEILAAIDVLKTQRQALSDNVNEVDELTDELQALDEGLKDTEDALKETIQAAQKFDEVIKDMEDRISDLDERMGQLNSKMDSFQSAYKTLESTIEEYNKTGILTADMMQTLLALEPEYLEMLDLKNGKLEFNKEKVDELITVNNDYMAQLTALSIAEEYEKLVKDALTASTLNLTLAEYQQQFATANLSSAIYKLALQFTKGEISSKDFKSALASMAESAGLAAEDVKYLTEQLAGYGDISTKILSLGAFSPMGLTKNYVESLTGETVRDRFALSGFRRETEEEYQKYLQGVIDKWKANNKNWFTSDATSGKTGKDAFEQQLKDMKTEYQKWIKLLEGDLYLAQEKNAPTDVIVNIYKKMQQEIHEAANQYRDLGLDDNNEYIIELKKQWWKYQDEIDKLYANDYNKFKEEQENKLSLLENQYNVLDSAINEAGKSENLQAQADAYEKIMEAAHNEAERLRADGVEKNKDAIQKAIDDWWSAYDSWKKINNKIATNVFDSFEDVISLADSLNVWDKLDFTKVDLLKDKLEAINQLFKEGKLEAADYKDALKDVGISLYNAELEKLDKMGKDAESQNKADVEAIKKTIESIKTLKEESNDYYDGLIDNLKNVQEENKRVNDQLDYQNSRQKLITNLEQARARSGIEYRQKEMEYQQQLVDLDEEWRQKQEELNLTDQMEQLEAIKKQAAEDFELSIQQLNEQITRLNTSLEDTLEGLDKQAEELGKKIFDAINGGTKENLSNVGNQILLALDESQSPIKQKASVIGLDISDSMFGTQLENAAMTSATNVLNIYKTAFINPMDAAITELMSKIMIPTNKDILSLGYGPLNPNRFQNNNSIVMYNNIPNVNAANSTIRGAQDIVNLNTNPSRF